MPWFEKAVQAAPYEPSMVANLGLVRWMQRRLDESYELLQRADSMGYSTPGGNFLLGVMSLRKSNPKLAMNYLKKVPVEKYPYRDLYLSLAQREAGKAKAAEESFRTFMKHHTVEYAASAFQPNPTE